MAQIKLYNSTAWVAPVPKLWNGTAWLEPLMKYWNGTAWVELTPSGPEISTTFITNNTQSTSFGTCYARLKLDNDGGVYLSNSFGTYGTSLGDWLVSGLNSEVWVQRSISSGTLDTDSIGAGRVVLSTDRVVGVETSSGTKACTLTLQFYDAASGGNLLGSKEITLSATFSGGGA